MAQRKKVEGFIKLVIVKVFFPPDNRRFRILRIKPEFGMHYINASIDVILAKIATDIETQFPQYEYKLVELPQSGTKRYFNFVHVGVRPQEESLVNTLGGITV